MSTNPTNGFHDAHRKKASEIFNVPENQVTDEQRRYAKQADYPLAYSVQGKFPPLPNLNKRQYDVKR